MKKLLVGAAVAAAVTAVGGTAFAGEVGGNGEPTPIAEFRAGSICSFSGQNDDPNEPGMFNGGRVQSFGDIVQEAVKLQPKGASTLTPLITGDGPGVNCRGFASQD
jgi:hypothetical protein